MSEMEKSPAPGHREFQQAAQEPRSSIVREFLHFLMHSKKWWLLPVIVILLFIGVLVFLSSTAAAPFIYTLF